MDLRLRGIAAHPRAGGVREGTSDFALSVRRPGVVLSRGALVVEQATSTLAVRALRRTPAVVEKLVYCGAVRAYLAFLDDRTVAAYRDGQGSASGIELASTAALGGESDRPCAMAAGSGGRPFAVFVKEDSPSINCVSVSAADSGKGPISMRVFKLLADIQGAQENVSGLDKGLSKLRGAVATKAKARPCPILAVAAHPNLDFAAAAYENGLLRVWDVSGKCLHSVFDSQLLLRESIIAINFHPGFPYLIACTSQGRIMSFLVRSRAVTKGEEPQLTAYKFRDRGRRFRAMCVMEGEPTVILLLTSTRRILVRLVSEQGQVLQSTRFRKASRRLQLEVGNSSVNTDEIDAGAIVSLECEPTFGLIAASFDVSSGNVYIYEKLIDRISGVRRAIVGAPVDTGFSKVAGNSFKGAVDVFSEGMFAQNGKLYSFGVRSKEVSELCRLPPSCEVRRIEVARDQFGSLFAALVFLYADGASDANAMYDVEECSTQFVIATRRGDGEAWNCSEPSDGATGCFLNTVGRHDRVLVMSADGKTASIRSFAGQRLSAQQKRNPQFAVGNSRGVQKYKVSDTGVSQVFRAPFASWCSVVFEDAINKRLAVSKNSYRGSTTFGDPDTMDGAGADDTYEIDAESEMPLASTERVLDIRWQWLPSGGRTAEQYLAAILTSERVYIVRDVFDPVCTFEFSSVQRSVVSFTLPTMCWMGPSVLIMFGQYLYSVTLDGRADLLAGLSQSDNASALLAALPDGIVYSRPPQDRMVPVSVVSRPIGMMSVLVRGMLALPSARGKNASHYIEKLQGILMQHDTSQGSEAVIDALIRGDLSPIAYILVTSRSGQHNLPALKRAEFLGRIGDLRGSLAVAEAEYSRLPSADSFHHGTELYRILQRILNMAIASGDFAVGQRCSELLGRKGTFSAFVECEGGYGAVTALTKYAKRSGHKPMAATLGILVDRSARSCVAVDDSGMPSIEQLRNTRAGIETYDSNAVMLGTEDMAEIFTVLPPVEDDEGALGKGQRTQLPKLDVSSVVGRLEALQTDDVLVLRTDDDVGAGGFGGDDLLGGGVVAPGADGEFGDGMGRGAGRVVRGGDPKDTRPLPAFDNLPDLGAELVQGPDIDIPGAAAAYSARQRATLDDMQAYTAGVSARAGADVQRRSHALHADVRADAAAHGMALQVAAGHTRDAAASRALESAFAKMREGRHAAARKDIARGRDALARAHAQRGDVSREQVAELVHYGVALGLLVTAAEVRASRTGATIAGRVAAVQMATAVAGLPLRAEHRAAALLGAVQANIALDNYGVAMQGLRALAEMGVRRPDLRDKYAACVARGGGNRMARLRTRYCCHTRHLVLDGGGELKCGFCPAYFSADAMAEVGLGQGDLCPCCAIGALV